MSQKQSVDMSHRLPQPAPPPTWVRSDFRFTLHAAQGVIFEEQIPQRLSDYAREHPEALEAYMQALFDVIEEGRYRHATLYGLQYDFARMAWVVLFTHPCLEGLSPSRCAPFVELHITPADVMQIPMTTLPALLQDQIRQTLG